MSKLQTIEEILEDLAIEASGYCCMNEDCDGYHPREDEDREKAKKKAKAAIEAMLRDIVGEYADLHTWDVYGNDPRNNIGASELQTVNDMNRARRKMHKEIVERATKYNLDI